MFNLKKRSVVNALSAFIIIFFVVLMIRDVSAELWFNTNVSDDAWIIDNNKSFNNGNNDKLLVGFNGSDVLKSLIRFDLSSNLTNQTLNSATLMLYLEDGTDEGRTHSVRTILDDWNEIDVNGNNQPSVSGIRDSQEVGTEEGKWIIWDVTDDVQDMVMSDLDNNGWMIMDESEIEADGSDQEVAYLSSENSNIDLRPMLLVSFGEGSNFDIINFLDLLAYWGPCVEGNCTQFDLNEDNMIDNLDFELFLLIWESGVFEVDLNDPMGTYPSTSEIPIDFNIDGIGLFTCVYHVMTSSGNLQIGETEIDNCESTIFDVNSDGSYIFHLTVSGPFSTRKMTSSFSVLTITSSSGGDDDDDDNKKKRSSSSADKSFWLKTYVKNDQEMEEKGEFEISLNERERVRILLDGEDHHVGLIEIDDGNAILEVSSDPVEASLRDGGISNFELTDDDIYDLQVEIKSLDDDGVIIVLRYIQEEIEGEEAITLFEEEEGAPSFLLRITGAVIGIDGTIRPTGWVMFLALVVAIFAFYQYYQTGKTETTKKKEKGKEKSKEKKEE